jgi:hypothetical protein
MTEFDGLKELSRKCLADCATMLIETPSNLEAIAHAQDCAIKNAQGRAQKFFFL